MTNYPPIGGYTFSSEAEVLAYARGELVRRADGQLVRADSHATGDGLIQRTRYDATGRPIHEFKSTTGRKDWMVPFMGTYWVQQRIANSNKVAEEISKGAVL